MHYTEFNWEIALQAEGEELKTQPHENLELDSSVFSLPIPAIETVKTPVLESIKTTAMQPHGRQGPT